MDLPLNKDTSAHAYAQAAPPGVLACIHLRKRVNSGLSLFFFFFETRNKYLLLISQKNDGEPPLLLLLEHVQKNHKNKIQKKHRKKKT